MTEPDPDELVVVARCSTPVEAGLARATLEAGGIDARVLDQEMSSMHWLLGQATGGVKVVVRASDVERAGEVLEDVRKRSAEQAQGHARDESAEELADRALKMAVFGLAVPPLQVWSLVLLWRLAPRLGEASVPNLRRKVALALACDCMLLFWTAIYVWNPGRPGH